MMEEMMTNNDLEKTILFLAMFFNENSEKQNQEFLNKLYEIFDKNESLYDSEVSLAFLNFQKFATTPWLTKHPQVTDGWEKSYIECIYNGLLPHFVRQIIEKNEGTPCSGDKEAFIIQKIKESVATGKNISLYETYEGKNNISKEKWKEQAYWSPKSFKDTDDVKTKFKTWYYLDMGYVKEKSETEITEENIER